MNIELREYANGDKEWYQNEYKAGCYGRTVIKIDRWFPSSKMCSSCGYVMETLPLDVRSWSCPRCESKHNRDKNAAKNIYNEGKRTVGTTELACGLGVRLESNRKRLRVKQEVPTLWGRVVHHDGNKCFA